MRTWPVSISAWARVRLFTSRMQCRKRSILTFVFSLASSAKAWDGARAGGRRAAARRPRQRQASPALVKPTSSISAAERVFVEADRGRERGVDRIAAAGRADLARVAGEPVGEVDAEPVAPSAAIGERRAARIGVGAERRRAGGGKRGIG